jgi:2-amino-4-hydroxy-6-hydroxymethyldihydropteridine diphosphokinase
MHRAYLLIGGNVGDTMKIFQEVITLLGNRAGTVVQKSSPYKTAPWGKPDQQDFLNQAVLVYTSLNAQLLMQLLLDIEKDLGRQRIEKNGPRIIDIDILFFDDYIIHEPRLTVPHPEVQNRRFALTPLAEIAPDLYHPVLHKTIAELLADCPDHLEVSLLE